MQRLHDLGMLFTEIAAFTRIVGKIVEFPRLAVNEMARLKVPVIFTFHEVQFPLLRAYWSVVRPFSWPIRKAILTQVKTEAASTVMQSS